ncbi:MAG: septum formation initiator family protein [Stappiaceae bacterium]
MPTVTLGVLAYFGFHALNGQYGLVGRERYERQAAELQTVLDGLAARRMQLEERVTLLRPESLDPDMIDERARASLNLLHPNEVAVLRRPAL